MRRLLNRDTVAGLLIFGLGLAATLYAQSSYRLGTFRTPGPGLFPMLVASVMTLVGAGLVVQALVQRAADDLPDFEARPFITILVAIAAFIILFPYIGYAPAVFALVLLSSFADKALSLPGKLLLAVVVTAIAIGLFSLLLGVRVPILGMRSW